ncbi:hypothetical protein [Deinococcus enclensis]|uniref:Nucleic acid-binding Zn ribbon protein n=1 Tax=Deinococcus enclensis TaxID=1049582 RepID=A0ABT9MJG0_9DEIO|nr:hypothetical protein [Deinococcus enclensis]MDP9766349.1 putative nucleic acid-binding Zn ribbon protein [Deinococcus enclensis]
MLKNMKLLLPAVATLTLLAACNPPKPTEPTEPTDPATVAPAAPVAGQSLDLMKIGETAQTTQATVQAMTDPASADFDADLANILKLMSAAGPAAQSLLQPLDALSNPVLRTLGFSKPGTLSAQALTPATTYDQKLPTGTWTVTMSGGVKTGTQTSLQPTDGYVVDDQVAGLKLTIEWKVSGAQTVWVERKDAYNTHRQELPTNMRVTVTGGSKTLASVALTMKPGACLSITGPEALTVNGWVGRETNPPLSMNLAYGWTDSAVTLKGSGQYLTKTRKATTDFDVTVDATTTGRCTPANMSIVLKGLKATASAVLPGQRLDAAVYASNVKNLEFSNTALSVSNPFAQVSGQLSASLKYNTHSVLTAFGELANGNANPLPGDQVKVQFVQNGQLVSTNLEALVMQNMR